MTEDKTGYLPPKGRPIEGRGTTQSAQVRRFEGRVMDDNATTSTELVTVEEPGAGLPPVLLGRATPAVDRQVRSFYASVAEIFERWVTRRPSQHTQRAYRRDVMAFVECLGIAWPDE